VRQRHFGKIAQAAAESMMSQASNTPPSQMRTIMLAIPPQRIALFKAIIESYDNLATLRTADPQQHHLKLYFAPEESTEIEALLDALQADFALCRLELA
jgi:hypothetical protein